MQTYKILEDKHIGKNAFVFGAGTSVHGFDIAPICDQVIMTVNSSFLLLPTDTSCLQNCYWLSNDALVRRWSYWTKIKESSTTRLVRDSWNKYYDEIPDFLIFWPRHTSEDIIDPDGDGLCYCSSVPSSIDLAIFMGCSRIFVFGVDQYHILDKRYFWEYWPKTKQPRMFIRGISVIGEYMPNVKQQKMTYEYDKQSYAALEGYSSSKNVKIYNCNPASKVDAFEKISTEQVLEMIK